MSATSEGQERMPSIARDLRRMNEETSVRLPALAGSDVPPRIGRIRILARAFGAFFTAYVMKHNFALGKKGFILSGEAAMETLLQEVKLWELTFRRAEGAGRLPPAGEADVRKHSTRYASWTS